ncbi:MAG: ornithine cyclodeaminase family protein [Terriglobales bacterium]
MREYSEEQVAERLPMSLALQAVEAAMRALAGGRAVNLSRRRLQLPRPAGDPPLAPRGAMLHSMAAAVERNGRWYMGYKIYSTGASGAHFTVGLYDGASGEPLARFAADRLGQRRTAAASGVATRLLASPHADTVAIIGAGWQGESQLEAIAAVRPIRQARVYSPTPERRERFAAAMSLRLGFEVAAVATSAAAVRGAPVVVTATSSRVPVIADGDLAAGVHINAIGSNAPGRQELEPATIRRAARLVVDSREQCQQESGDLLAALPPAAQGGWDRVEELAAVLAHPLPPPDPAALTLFKSTGMALWDVACAAAIWEQQ